MELERVAYMAERTITGGRHNNAFNQMNQVALLILTLSLSLASILVGGGPKSQSKSATEAPTLEQILDKYVQALGGRAALERVNTRASKGAFTSSNLKTKGPIENLCKSAEQMVDGLTRTGLRKFTGAALAERSRGKSIRAETVPAICPASRNVTRSFTCRSNFVRHIPTRRSKAARY
jgi:hypothetical protein